MRNIVKRQSTRVIKKTTRSRVSAYWDYVEQHNRITDGVHEELAQSDPDRLPENAGLGLSLVKEVFGAAVEHMQGRQREVYLLHMREGKSLAEVGEILGMTKSSAQVYLTRAIKFITGYCREAVAKGNV